MATDQMNTIIRHLRRTVVLQHLAGMGDGQLLESFIARNDEVAFELLVRRHGSMVLAVCRRILHNYHDAEDAFQATFLVLARKASSVRPSERVANWLHGVARRTALKARTMRAKMQVRQRQVTEMPEPQPVQQDHWHDLKPLLDQELSRLPEPYRLPILLCDLEGNSIKEATRQLGWPQGTLAGRLDRGRRILAKRLTQRGVTLSGGALAAVLSEDAASACLPTSLVVCTVQAAGVLAAGQAAVDVISVQVATLTEGVLKAMSMTKLKILSTILMVASLFACSGGLVTNRIAAAQQSKVASDRAQQASRQLDQPKENYKIFLARFFESGKAIDRNAPPKVATNTELEGTWSIVSGEIDGQPILNEKMKHRNFIVQGDNYTYEDELIKRQGTFSVNMKITPKTIKTIPTQGKAKDFALGIYRLDGDTLKFCFPSGNERPTEFTSERGKTLFILKREKAGRKENATPPPYVSFSGAKNKLTQSTPDVPKIEHTRPNSSIRANKTKFDPGMVSIGPDGKTYKYFSVELKVVTARPNERNEVIYPTMVVEQGHRARLLRKNCVWILDRSRKEDVKTASILLDVKVSDGHSGKLHLDLSLQNNEVQSAKKNEKFVVGNSLVAIQEMYPGKAVALVLTRDDKGTPWRWVELTVNEGVPLSGDSASPRAD